LILLSIFSGLLSTFSWLLVPPALNAYHFTHTGFLIFFVLGTAWWQWERPLQLFGIKIGPWIVGLLLSIVVWDDLPENWRHQAMIVTWPLLSGSVRSVPKFFRGKLLPSWPPISIRKELTVMFLFHVLISLWLQFGFLLNQWMINYPSLLTEDLTRSSFAIFQGIETPEISQGNIMLNAMEAFLRGQIEGQQLPRVNQVISGLVENRIDIDDAVKKRLPDIEENQWWQLRGTVIQRQGGYSITLFAIFQGLPMAKEEYYVEKSCEISRTFRQPEAANDRPSAEALDRTQMECGPASDRQSGPIPFQGQGFD
jgi:hypothetical protein